MTNTNKKKYFTYVIKWAWIIIIILFVCIYLNKNYKIVINIISEISISNILCAYFAIVIGKILLVFNMQYSLLYIGKKINFIKSFHFYNISQLGKYIPGSFWHFVGRIGYYRTESLAFSDINKALILEILFISIGSFLVGLSFLMLNKDFFFIVTDLYIKKETFLYIVLPIMIIVSSTFVFTKTQFLIKIMRQFFINYRLNLKIFLNQLSVWLFFGTSFYFIIKTDIGGLNLYAYSIGLYSIAYLIGFLFIFAPAGIGVREFVLITGLNLIDIPVEVKLSLVGFHRFIYIVAEVSLSSISGILLMYIQHNKRHNHSV